MLDASRHDFGVIESGTSVEHVATLRNTGTEPVRVVRVSASCGCTVVAWPDEPLAPGAEAPLTVALDATGRLGPIRESVMVIAESAGEEHLLPLALAARALIPGVAQGHVRFEADEARLGAVPAGERLVHAFRLQNAGGRALRITGGQTVPEGGEVLVPAVPVLRDEVAVVEVVLPPSMTAGGPVAVAVLLDTDDDVQPVKSLYLEATAE